MQAINLNNNKKNTKIKMDVLQKDELNSVKIGGGGGGGGNPQNKPR
jgi:hypothetical protein